MNLDGIVAQAREWLDDEALPYLWTDESLIRWANEAQDEACLRTRFLVEDDSPAVCDIPLVVGQVSYPLHPSIIVARRVEYRHPDRLPEVLRRTTTTWLDRNVGGHWTSHEGRPCAVVQDLRRRHLRLNRIPDASALGMLRLTVWRRPLEAERLEVGSDEPVIDEAFHLKLAHWICHRAFLRKDSEAHDPQRAAEHLAIFEGEFGTKPSLHRLIALATDEAGEVESYWY